MRFLPGIVVLLLAGTSWVAAAKDPAKHLPPDARVAVIGDSITEQKLYSKFIECYLLACTGRQDIQVFQFGWGGERAGGFAARLENDLSVFNPTVATTCYGMNDGSYTAFTPAIGAEYEKNMRRVIDGLKKIGVQHVIVGSPGAVDTKFFTRFEPAVYNDNLAHLRDIAKKLAGEYQQPFANVHDTMIEAMAKAKPVLGEQYDVCGPDGFHPGPNGHLLMAQAFLKALGLDGDIGTITIDLKGETTATSGHRIVSGENGVIKVESATWPFCFDRDLKASGSTRSILPFTTFNQDLNRFTLVVKGLTKDRATVTWGKASLEFPKVRLEQGINLAAEFPETPFDAAFMDLMNAVAVKQAHETTMIKSLISPFRSLAGDVKADPELGKAIGVIRKKMLAKEDLYLANVRKRLKPVEHRLEVRE